MAALLFYTRRVKSLDGKGTWLLWTLVALTGTLWVSQPWAPPAPDATAVALTALGLWILPPWAHWIERHRQGESLEG